MYGRRLRSPLDNLQPDLLDKVRNDKSKHMIDEQDENFELVIRSMLRTMVPELLG